MNKYTKLYLGGAALYVAGIAISFCLASNPGCCAADNASTSYQHKEKVQMVNYGHIDAKALKNLIDTKTKMVILDARNKDWDDGRRVPGGKSLPFDSDAGLYTQVAPDKNALIVVYCGSEQCPAGKTLVGKMLSEGYTHILEYAGGIQEWANVLHYPIEQN